MVLERRATAPPAFVRVARGACLMQDRHMPRPALDLSALTAAEKLELLDEIWQSLSPDDVPVSPEVCAELDRRLDRFDEDLAAGVVWEDVRAEMTPGKA
jgi:putative addiction module component (TIGR02574 family)